jgi:phosphoribosyl 1,2-cyclic phosphodiesterase
MLNVTFHGVRGSAPAPGAGTQRYGGNTSCVALEAPAQEPLLLDLGTGARAWAATLGGRPLRARALLTHVHFDHVQGLPFLEALDAAGARLEVWGPDPGGRRLADVIGDLIRPPYFPVRPTEAAGELRFCGVEDDTVALGEARVTVRSVPHLGSTNGYRVEWQGVSVAYVSDHQAPRGLDTVDEAVLELADGVDLLIHDAQFTASEWERKGDWGHSTVDYAVLVARQSGARRLALFHHDPARDDDEIDRLLDGARRTGERLGVDEVLAASEGTTISFERNGR